MTRPLWPHQELALREAGRHFSNGATSVCVVMPTGAGKTETGGAACSRHVAKNSEAKILWVAHREELVTQAYDTLTDSWGLECGVIQANPSRPVNPHRPIQIASTQTLLARGQLPDATFGVFDEYHHYASDKWLELVMGYRRRRIPLLGLTATPIRGDERGFEDSMDALVTPITMKELIRGGFLVPFELVRPPHRLKSDQIAQHPVDAYVACASGRKAIVFAANVNAAREYAEKFNARGIRAEVIWGNMEAGKRRQVLEDYKAGLITVLTNVGVLTEGFDDRATSCVILARSVGTISLYLQMCGRGLRTDKDKTDAIIIDLHGTSHDPEFGRPDDDREWTLEGDGIKHKTADPMKVRLCQVCKVVLDPGGGNVCDFCGIVRPEAVPPDVLNLKLVRYAAKLREPEHVRRAYFEKLKAIARAKGWSPWQPHTKYKAIYGESVPRHWG